MTKSRLTSFMYVFFQFSILALLIFAPTVLNVLPSFPLIGKIMQVASIIGIIIAMPSIRSSLTIMPEPKSNARLGSSGLYKYVRHPMYSFVILFGFSSAISDGSISSYTLAGLLTLVLYTKSLYEERLLRSRFGDYALYARNTKRFVPYIW